MNYKRIPVLDYAFPHDAAIEEFDDNIKTLPDDCWLHFRCKQGKGWTTLFMAFYDMMRNPDIALKDIVYRQFFY